MIFLIFAVIGAICFAFGIRGIVRSEKENSTIGFALLSGFGLVAAIYFSALASVSGLW